MKIINKKIAITHDFLITMGGAELVLKELLDLFPQADIITPVNWISRHGPSSDLVKGHKIYTSNINGLPHGFRRYWKLLLPFFISFFENYDFSKYDIVISISSGFSKWINVDPPTIHIAYINTPPRFLWGMETTYYHKIPKIIRFIFSPIYKRWQYKDKFYAGKASIIIANSKNIQKKIKTYYSLDSDIIYPPVMLSMNTPSQHKGDFYLIINRLVAYKQIDKIIRAFNNTKRKLIIIGTGPEERYLHKIAKKNIEFTGFISNDERDRYLSKCIALIYSGVEDFGIAMVESMNFGKPVIAFNGGGAKEIIANNTGVLIDDYKLGTIQKALDKIESMQFNTNNLIKQSQKFSTDIFKKEIIALLQKM